MGNTTDKDAPQTKPIECNGVISKKDEITYEKNDCVRCLLLLNDAKKMFVGSGDENIYAFELDETTQNYKYTAKLKGHSWPVKGLAKTKDEKRIISCSADKDIRIWDVDSLTVIKAIEGHNDDINTIISLNDGTFATGSTDKRIKIWDENLELIKTLRKHDNRVYQLCEIKNNRLISGAKDEDFLLVWNLKDDICEENHTIQGVTVWCSSNCMLYFEKEDILIVTGKEAIYIVDLKKYKVIRSIEEGFGGHDIWSFIRLEDNSYIITTNSVSNPLYQCKNEFNDIQPISYPYQSDVYCCVSIPGKNVFLTGDGNNGSIIEWYY